MGKEVTAVGTRGKEVTVDTQDEERAEGTLGKEETVAGSLDEERTLWAGRCLTHDFPHAPVQDWQ